MFPILLIWICKIVHDTTALFRIHRKLFYTAILPLPLFEKSFTLPKYLHKFMVIIVTYKISLLFNICNESGLLCFPHFDKGSIQLKCKALTHQTFLTRWISWKKQHIWSHVMVLVFLLTFQNEILQQVHLFSSNNLTSKHNDGFS